MNNILKTCLIALVAIGATNCSPEKKKDIEKEVKNGQAIFDTDSIMQNTSPSEIRVEFSSHTTADQVQTLTQQLKAKNVDLEFTYLEFTPENTLSKIQFSVDFHDGFKGESKLADLKTLQKNRIGFYRNYRENGSSLFGIF
ncbi:MAG: hypothetical protein JXR07_18780 [Reichenbachiella sp.]